MKTVSNQVLDKSKYPLFISTAKSQLQLKLTNLNSFTAAPDLLEKKLLCFCFLYHEMTLGIRFFSFNITYSFSFLKGNGLFHMRKTKCSLTFCDKFHANEPMYMKAIEV